MRQDMFVNVPTNASMLLNDVKSGKTGLPELQRPYVWADSKVRDLLDSMFKGYPVGYVMLWDSPDDFKHSRAVGTEDKAYTMPDDLVIDGQQRLTGLLSAMYGIEIVDKNYKKRIIKISFNPFTKEFAVWTQAYEKNKEWISEISEVFKANQVGNLHTFGTNYISALNDARTKVKTEPLTTDEENSVHAALSDLISLGQYSLPTMRILSSADEEDVAEIFVRVNSGGQKLNEKNFIETLLSVYDVDIHNKITDFCAASRIPQKGTSYNQILKVDPSHLIRMAVGCGFKRARLKYAYQLLRGKDLQRGSGGTVTKERRDANLKIFRDALDRVTNLNDWHAFMNLFVKAGYIDERFVASTNAVVYSYVLYLIGKYEYKLQTLELERIIKKWIFMSTLTYFYTGSTETEVEKQFNDLKDVNTGQEFIDYLDGVINSTLTDDYFNVTLPKEFVTSSTQAPVWYAYVAAINVLGNPVLFGTSPQASLLQMAASGTKNAADIHHIFPKAYLTKQGFTTDRERNQIANYTYLDYQTNIDIGEQAPAEYTKDFKEKLGNDRYYKTLSHNAIPSDFDKLDYNTFLAERRVLMSKTIRVAFEELSK